MRPKAYLILVLLVAMIPAEILSQNFSKVDAGFPVAHEPAAAWADVDNDGDLDAFISGKNISGTPIADIFRNDNGSFTHFNTGIPGMYSGACAFGDFNNDGLADLLLCGTNGSGKYSVIYRNNGGGVFTDIGAGLNGLTDGDAAWGDFNNDGWADLVITGEDESGQAKCMVYINNEGSSFTLAAAGIPGHKSGEVAWSDFDLDGDMDLAIIGINNTQNLTADIYINNGGSFSPLGAGLTGLFGATIAWGDYNNDSWPDLLISGEDMSGDQQTMVYKNNDGSSLTAISGPFNGIVNGSAIWGDFDNDGDLDFIVAGRQSLNSGGGAPPVPEMPAEVLIYKNQGNDQFASQRILLSGVENSDIVCGDYDNDTDLDLLVCGLITNPLGGNNYNAAIYRNETSATNNPPIAPSGLIYGFNGNDLNISWNPAFDDKTPSAGLNYNLRIGTGPSNMNVLSALAGLPDGFRRIASAGNSGGNVTWTIHGLDFGVYYASVQAIDPSYRGSPFSAFINIQLPPSATFTMPEYACVNNEVVVTYTGNASSTAQYDWDFADGTANPGIGQGPHTVYWDTPGPRNLSLSVTENGASSDPFYLSINVLEPPMADAGADQSIMQGTTTQLSGSASGGSGSYAYYWMPDSLLLDPGQPDPTTIPLLQTEQFTLEVTDLGSGCTSEDNMIVYVSGGPLSLSVSADPDTICEGDSTQLLALAGGGSANYTYSWSSSPPGFSSSEPGPVAFPSATTTYYVELSDGTENLIDSVLVTVWPLPAAAGSISGPDEVCVGSELVLYEIDPVPEATGYLWELTDGIIGGSISNSIELSFPTFVENASITVTATNDCGTGPPSILEINTIQVPGLPGKPFGEDSICTTTDTLSQYQIEEQVPGALYYEWEFWPEEAGIIEGEGMTAYVHWVKNWSGQAFVRARAVNECGPSTWSETLELHAFNCLGLNDHIGDQISVLIYPNPADEVLSVRCSISGEDIDFDLHLRDLYGRTVVETSHPGRGVVEINTSDIPAGMYILFLHNVEGLSLSKRIVIQH